MANRCLVFCSLRWNSLEEAKCVHQYWMYLMLWTNDNWKVRMSPCIGLCFCGWRMTAIMPIENGYFHKLSRTTNNYHGPIRHPDNLIRNSHRQSFDSFWLQSTNSFRMCATFITCCYYWSIRIYSIRGYATKGRSSVRCSRFGRKQTTKTWQCAIHYSLIQPRGVIRAQLMWAEG